MNRNNIFRPPHCKFLGLVDRDAFKDETEQTSEHVPNPSDHVPSDVRYYAVVREKDGFSDTPSADELAYSVSSYGYDYSIARRKPMGEVEQVSEDEYFSYMEDIAERKGWAVESEKADVAASEHFGYNPNMKDHMDVVFYWMR